MAFRKPKSDRYRREREWYEWIDGHRTQLVAIGLPAEVFLDEERWQDFLENGHLHWHGSSNFQFGDLSTEQLIKLRNLLEGECGDSKRLPPLLRWLRVKSGKD